LVVVAGLTPQVITETLYYLTQVRDPPITISEIYVLTTEPGRRRILTSLLAPHHGQFYRLCAEYGLDPACIAFDAQHVRVFADAAGVPLDDIRTAADSAAVADQILAFIHQLTDDSATRLFCSLAGGRKTQSVLLGFALQLYGRAQDILLHVLVDEELEGNPDFFYPPKTPRIVRGRSGRQVDAHTARVDVAEIPYLRLRAKVVVAGRDPITGFGLAIAQAQEALDILPELAPLVIIPGVRRIYIGAIEIPLQPVEIVLYAQLAQAKMQTVHTGLAGGFMSLDDLDGMREAMLQRYERVYGAFSERVEALRRTWKERIPPESLRSHVSTINRKIRRAVSDEAQAAFYIVDSEGEYGATRYGLRLHPGSIELREG